MWVLQKGIRISNENLSLRQKSKIYMVLLKLLIEENNNNNLSSFSNTEELERKMDSITKDYLDHISIKY
jgi:hypothetical protein